MAAGMRFTQYMAAVAICAGVLSAVRVRSQGVAFAPGVKVPVGAGPGEIALVDLNGDRHLDMVTRHLLQKRVAVMLGNGAGGFAPAAGSPMTLAYQPGSIEVDDINGDGAPDLAVSISERDGVDVFLGDRKGTFTRAGGSPFAASASTSFFTRAIRLVDVNGDRRLDIITANGSEHTIGVLLGGRGGFTAGPITRLGFRGGRSAAAFGDIDGDGRVDAIAGHRGEDEDPAGRLSIFRGDGAGAFKEAGQLPIGAPGPFTIVLADVNADRHLDVAVTHSHRNSLSVLLNDGRGAFTRAAGSPFDIRTEAFGLVTADIDGDRHADLVAATGTNAVVLLGDGTGRFAAGPSFAAGPGAYNLAVADINGDGKLDLAMSSFEGDAVTILLRR
jgi:VCBS repeat protein